MADDLLSNPTPLAPPGCQDEMVSWLRLIRSHRVGASTFFRLMHEHGSADAALGALPQIASAAGVPKYLSHSASAAKAEMDAGYKMGARLICFGAELYPKALTMIPDPPPVLWALGDLELSQRPTLAIVGARNASSLGTRMAAGLANDLGHAGFVIASGLARGIDTAAHLAALPHGTIAVQAGGLDKIYPKENAKLHEDITSAGLRLSEQPIGMTPQAKHFPRRNRIISGLSRAVIMIEAAAKSGSLITARDALDQGREVLAVPGHPLDARAAGGNSLIRDGATLIRSAQDIIQAVGAPIQSNTEIKREQNTPETTPAFAPKQSDILNLLGATPIAEDQLIRDLKTSPAQLAPHLMQLEMSGQIIRQSGGLLSRNI